MYLLSDDQIEFVRRDILAQGIQNEGLQQDLLDHICCVVENELADGEDFETFYHQRIKQFYKKELKEIEEETIALLNFKHYYVMKKVMLLSGGVLTALLVISFLLRFLYLPGGSIAMLLGAVLLNFVFLPLLFTLKVKENKTLLENITSGIATLCAMLMNLGLIFKLQVFPGADALVVAAFGTLLLGFLPIYFFTGIQRADTKVNTIVSSIIILSSVALVLILLRSPKALHDFNPPANESVLRSEQILAKQRKLAKRLLPTDGAIVDSKGKEINELCEKMKQFLLTCDTGSSTFDFANKGYISEMRAADYIDNSIDAQEVLIQIDTEILSYNKTLQHGLQKLPALGAINQRKVSEALNDLIQVQIIISQNYIEQSLKK
ncbi:MAG: hypothetical protein IPP30_09390 [Flavobacterium sp.]|nr:hypothetical protein [Flavobacterium sp.]